jgi:hypothetical protein
VITFIVQLIFSIALSLGSAWFLGVDVYIIGAVLAAMVITGCLLAVPGKQDLDVDEGVHGFAWRDLAIAAGSGALLGALWPALPIIVAWGVGQRRARAAASRTSIRQGS